MATRMQVSARVKADRVCAAIRRRRDCPARCCRHRTILLVRGCGSEPLDARQSLLAQGAGWLGASLPSRCYPLPGRSAGGPVGRSVALVATSTARRDARVETRIRAGACAGGRHGCVCLFRWSKRRARSARRAEGHWHARSLDLHWPPWRGLGTGPVGLPDANGLAERHRMD